MASSVNGTTITLTKGDTFKSYIQLFDKEDNEYIPVAGDKVRFAAKKKYKDPECVIFINVPIETMLLHIPPVATKDLAVSTYCYDIQLTYANGDIDTFIDRAQLILTEEVE